MNDKLENLRKKRLQELQQQLSSQELLEEQKLQKQELDEQKKQILRSILTPQAKERLGRIRVARPELADAVEYQLIMVAQSGRLKNKINDEELRRLLVKLQPKKREFTIRRR